MKTCEAAVLVLRETDNPAVMWGDEGLCHMIADRAGIRMCGQGPFTSNAVLKNLSQCPGELIPGYTSAGNGVRSRVRIFWLPEHAPKSWIERRRLMLNLPQIIDFHDSLESVDPEDTPAFHSTILKALELTLVMDEDVAHQFSMSRTSLDRWKNGTNAPHSALRKSVYMWLRERAASAIIRLESP